MVVISHNRLQPAARAASSTAASSARFPPEPDDVIHVEEGSGVGAESGDAGFRKWLGDPHPAGWSPDRNSWAALTAAKNRAFTAQALAPRRGPLFR